MGYSAVYRITQYYHMKSELINRSAKLSLHKVVMVNSTCAMKVIHFCILVIKMGQLVKMEEIDKTASLSAQGAW